MATKRRTVAKVTLKKKARFLEVLGECGNVSAACDAVGAHRNTLYRMRERDPEFAEQWGNTIERAVDRLESVAWQRAEQSSDTLLIFLLKGRRPDVFKDRAQVEHSGEISIGADAKRELTKLLGSADV